MFVAFDYVPNNKVLVQRLKEARYKDSSRVLYSGIRCTYPYFEIDTLNREIKFLNMETIRQVELYRTKYDLALITKNIFSRSLEEDLLDIPYSC